MRRTNHAAVAIGVVLSLAASAVRAAAAAPRVDWSGPAQCPRPADLLLRIARLLGTPVAALQGKLVGLGAVVTRREGRWQIRLALRTAGGGGERVFAADGCAQLVDGAALVAALAIDPSAVRARRAAQPAIRARKRRIQLALRPLAGVDLGSLPAPGVSFGLAGALLWPALRLELDLSHGLPVRRSLGGSGAAELRLPIAGSLRGCWRRPLGGRFELDLCLGGAVAWLRGAGIDISEPRSGGTAWAAALAGGALSLAIAKRWWLRLEGRGGASFGRAAFEIQGIGEVHRSAILVGQLAAGVEARLF